jgi:uncharacterized repeat protein (TIGR01451 family)
LFSISSVQKNINIGDNIVYNVSLKNTGKRNCLNTSYSLSYSSNESFVSATPSPTSSDYYWNIGILKPRAVYSTTITTKNTGGISGDTITTEAWATADSTSDVYATNIVTISSTSTTLPPPIIPSSSNMNIQAWIYPGHPACTANTEYSDGRTIDTLKPEYYTVHSDGKLRQRTATSDGCNGYSTANVESVKANSIHQYVTVSGDIKNTRVLFSSLALQDLAIKTLTDFTVSTGFTGVELDWEGFGNWTNSDYENYKRFTSALQESLHQKGKLLMIDVPAISDTTYQSYYNFKYEDFKHIDYVNIMAYDYQYDFGAGVPVAPEPWVRDIIIWAKARLPVDSIIIGIPAYGYHGPLGSYDISIDTYAQSKTYPGYSKRTLNSDGEETWTDSGIYYAAQTSNSLSRKRDLVESLGIKSVSVWHLGGNLWFE